MLGKRGIKPENLKPDEDIKKLERRVNLEGLNISLQQTKTILEGVNVPNLKIDEIQCVLNLRDAWKYVINNIEKNFELPF